MATRTLRSSPFSSMAPRKALGKSLMKKAKNHERWQGEARIEQSNIKRGCGSLTVSFSIACGRGRCIRRSIKLRDAPLSESSASEMISWRPSKDPNWSQSNNPCVKNRIAIVPGQQWLRLHTHKIPRRRLRKRYTAIIDAAKTSKPERNIVNGRQTNMTRAPEEAKPGVGAWEVFRRKLVWSGDRAAQKENTRTCLRRCRDPVGKVFCTPRKSPKPESFAKPGLISLPFRFVRPCKPEIISGGVFRPIPRTALARAKTHPSWMSVVNLLLCRHLPARKQKEKRKVNGGVSSGSDARGMRRIVFKKNSRKS